MRDLIRSIGVSFVLCSALVAGGCATAAAAAGAAAGAAEMVGPGVKDKGPTNWTEKKPANYSGEECDEVLHPPDDYGGRGSVPRGGFGEKKGTPADYALLATCEQRFLSYENNRDQTLDNPQKPKLDKLEVEKIHEKFDDRKFNHLWAGLVAFYAHYGFPSGSEGHQGRPSESFYGEPLRGIGYAYAKQLDTDALRSQLSREGFPKEAVEVFVELVEAVPEREESNRQAMSKARWKVLFEVPAEVMARRAKNYERYSDLYDRLDQLERDVDSVLSGSGDALTVEQKLADLRYDYLMKCDVTQCFLTPEFQRISNQLTRLYLGTKDAAGVYAERELYDDRDRGPRNRSSDDRPRPLDLIPLMNEIHHERMTTATPLYGKYKKYKRARDDGADKESALAMVDGGPLLRKSPYNLVLDDVELEMEKLGGHVTDAQPHNMRAEVKTAQKQGDRVRLVFVQRAHTRHIPYDCKETNKVERIEPDGTLVYEKKCKYREKTTESAEFPPITVPAHEGESIESGDDVRFVTVGDKEQGHVVRVFRDDEIAQVRSHVVP